jgi:hypothetical protein
MYNKQIQEINKDLEKTGKAIIALGCSFVQGQGAFDDEMYENYKWNFPGMGSPLQIDLKPSEEAEVLSKYPTVISNKGHIPSLDFKFMEYKNAFVNVLCKKYFQGEYTPINLGIRGCGNRATIKELYFRPEIKWDLIKEIIVIYCPSGLERFDFVNDEWDEHFHWKAMWPHYENMEESGRKSLWEGYGKTLWSSKFEVIEQISHVQELITWCKMKDAKLIVTPGFDRRYTKDNFKQCLKTNITRDMNGTVKNNRFFNKVNHDYLLDLFPWDNMFEPAGHKTFVDLVMAQEPNIDDITDHFFQFLGKGSPDKWITPCSHPAAKGHDLFAQYLFNHIKGQ